MDREKLIYEKHLDNETLNKVYCITYGVNDKNYSNLLDYRFKIISMPNIFNSKIGIIIYSFILPLIHYKYIKECNILKNDQMDGSWTAVIAKILFYKRKKLIIRTGFTLSIFMKQKRYPFFKFISILIEKFAYFFCDVATVSSIHSKEYIVNKYNLKSENVKVLFNYIDIKKFKKSKSQSKKNRLLFIGRLDNQKNLINLILALKKINIPIDIYGDGKLKDQLILLSKKNNSDVNFLGIFSNAELPKILGQYKYYILPSFYEGMPKTLIEAMACGLVCIGTDTLGINEVIENNQNGYLINGFSVKAIKDTIIKIYEKKNHNLIQMNAIKSATDKFSIDNYAIQEAKIFSNFHIK